MDSNLDGHQLTIECYMNTKSDTNLMVITKYEPLINMHRLRRKNPNISLKKKQNMKEK